MELVVVWIEIIFSGILKKIQTLCHIQAVSMILSTGKLPQLLQVLEKYTYILEKIQVKFIFLEREHPPI